MNHAFCVSHSTICVMWPRDVKLRSVGQTNDWSSVWTLSRVRGGWTCSRMGGYHGSQPEVALGPLWAMWYSYQARAVGVVRVAAKLFRTSTDLELKVWNVWTQKSTQSSFLIASLNMLFHLFLLGICVPLHPDNSSLQPEAQPVGLWHWETIGWFILLKPGFARACNVFIFPWFRRLDMSKMSAFATAGRMSMIT